MMVKIRGDSVAMLATVVAMRPASSSHGLGVVAREMALDLSEGVYKPDIAAEHVAGVSNKTADVLSRKYEPGAIFQPPAFLDSRSEVVLPRRSRDFYRTMAPPRQQRRMYGAPTNAEQSPQQFRCRSFPCILT